MKHQGDLILKEDLILDEDLIVEGNIICEDGLWNIKAENIEALDINYWAVCYARNSFKCKSIKGRRKNCKHFCLDNEIQIGSFK